MRQLSEAPQLQEEDLPLVERGKSIKFLFLISFHNIYEFTMVFQLSMMFSKKPGTILFFLNVKKNGVKNLYVETLPLDLNTVHCCFVFGTAGANGVLV